MVGAPPQGFVLNKETEISILKNVSVLRLADCHLTYLFPDTTHDHIAIRAGPIINEFGNWTVVQSSNGSYFYDYVNKTYAIHISAFEIEETTLIDQKWIFEFGYGPDISNVTIVSRHRYSSADRRFLDAPHQMRVRSECIVENTTFWYRAMGTLQNSTLGGYFRYYFLI